MGREDARTWVEADNKPLCISIPKAAGLLGISRNTGYVMATMGQLPTIRCGKRRLMVPIAGLMRMLQHTNGTVTQSNATPNA